MLIKSESAKLGNKASYTPSMDEVIKPTINRLDLFIIGCGTVGGSLLEQIKQQKEKLYQANIKLTVYGIADTQNFLLNQQGIDLSDWKSLLHNSDVHYSFLQLKKFLLENDIPNPVLVDCTGSKEIADQYTAFLGNHMHIVTANKIANGQPMGFYKEIRRVAEEADKKFHYETNVGAGLPVIEPLQKLIQAGDQLIRFEGILSGSLSYIFGELHKGLTISEATEKAMGLGYTEPDPRDDLSGMDVARKVLIIAREAGLQIDLKDIELEPVLPPSFMELGSKEAFLEKLPELNDTFNNRCLAAEADNCVLRYVASINNNHCKVSIETIPEDNPLYQVKDGENVLAFYSKYYQPKPLVMKGYGAGPDVTAAGVFSDILRIL